MWFQLPMHAIKQAHHCKDVPTSTQATCTRHWQVPISFEYKCTVASHAFLPRMGQRSALPEGARKDLPLTLSSRVKVVPTHTSTTNQDWVVTFLLA